jgi:hypothetical protein
MEVAMNPIRKSHAGTVLAVAVAMMGLAACGHHASVPAGSASPSSATHPVTSAPAPAPSASAAPTANVISYRVSYPWHWPNDVGRPGLVAHPPAVPPVPELVAIIAGEHPKDLGGVPYNRLSFTFTKAFPSYQFRFVPSLVSDPSGNPVSLGGQGVLEVTFRQAQAHSASGGSSVATQPPAHLGYSRMVGWAQAGDFEGVLSYGIGLTWPAAGASPHLPVRAIEVEKVSAQGQHLYVVAIDIAAG